jgi:hypothetical protein
MFTKKNGGNCPQEKEQQSLHRSDHLQGSNDLLILTSLLPSSDDRDSNFLQTPLQNPTEIMTQWSIPVTGTA